MRRLDPQADTTTLGVRFTPDLLAVIDREADRIRALVPGVGVDRSVALRSIVSRYEQLASSSSPTRASSASSSSPTEPERPELLARYLSARDSEANSRREKGQRISNVSAAKACGVGETTIREWASGRRTLAPAVAVRLGQWLDRRGG